MTSIKDILRDVRELPCDKQDIEMFAGIVTVLFLLITWYYHLTGTALGITMTIMALIATLALSWWQALRVAYRLWMGIAMIIGWFVLRILLIFVFVFIVIPTGVILRLSGTDLLKRGSAKSYWSEVEPQKDKKQFLKKF